MKPLPSRAELSRLIAAQHPAARVKAALAKVVAHYGHIGAADVEVRTLLNAFQVELVGEGCTFERDEFTWVKLSRVVRSTEAQQ